MSITHTQGYLAEPHTVQPRAAHDALLLYAVTDQLGALAGRVVRALILYGALTLKEIAEAVKAQYGESNTTAFAAMTEARAVRSAAAMMSHTNAQHTNHTHHTNLTSMNSVSEVLLTDAAIKEVVMRLLLHRMVYTTYHQETSETGKEATLYRLHARHALLGRVLFPLVLCEVRRRYGAVAEAVVTAFHQLGVLPVKAAVQLAARRLTRIPHTHTTNTNSNNRSVGDDESNAMNNHSDGGGAGSHRSCEACRAVAQLERSALRLVPQLRQDGWLESVGSPTVSHENPNTHHHNNNTNNNNNEREGEEEARLHGKRGRETTGNNDEEEERGGGSGEYEMTRAAALVDETQACRLNLHSAAARLFESALQQFVMGRYGHAGTHTTVEALHACLAGFIQLDLMPHTRLSPLQQQQQRGEGEGEGEEDEVLPVRGGVFTSAQLQRAIAATSQNNNNNNKSNMRGAGECSGEAVVVAALGQLCRPLTLYFSSQTNTSASASAVNGMQSRGLVRRLGSREEGREGYCMLYHDALRALQEGVCEQVIFTRHGVVGVRVMKLLWRHHFLEDRTLAEQAITTHAKVREVLHAMMQDGYVMQQELPKTDNLNERLAKHSFFLWGCDVQRNLLPAVREQLAQSLHHALVKLAEAMAQRDSVIGLTGNTHNNSTDTNAESYTAASALAESTSHGMFMPQERNNSGAAAGEQGVVRTNEEWSHMFAADAMQSAALSTNREMSRQEKVSEEVIQRVVRAQRNVCGLQSCALALMRMLFLVDCL